MPIFVDQWVIFLTTFYMDWKEYILKSLIHLDPETSLEFGPPVSASALRELMEQLQLEALPPSLVDFYLQTDGVEEYLDGVKTGALIWPVARLLDENLSCRSVASSVSSDQGFDHLLFFADAGNGDLFGFIAVNGSFEHAPIVVWNHEDDCRNRVASDLESFIAGWMSGAIKL